MKIAIRKVKLEPKLKYTVWKWKISKKLSSLFRFFLENLILFCVKNSPLLFNNYSKQFSQTLYIRKWCVHTLEHVLLLNFKKLCNRMHSTLDFRKCIPRAYRYTKSDIGGQGKTRYSRIIVYSKLSDTLKLLEGADWLAIERGQHIELGEESSRS